MVNSVFYEFLRLTWKRQRMQRFISPCQEPGLKWRRRRSKWGSSSTTQEWFLWLKTASRSPHSPAPLSSRRTVPQGTIYTFHSQSADPVIIKEMSCHKSSLRNEAGSTMDSGLLPPCIFIILSHIALKFIQLINVADGLMLTEADCSRFLILRFQSFCLIAINDALMEQVLYLSVVVC